MSVLKCKMCGGDLNIIEDSSVCECEYCGTRQTIPAPGDEKKAKLFERANRLRFNCEFDKAGGVYENIVSEYPDESEGYWGLLLCRYGIEYVDDPISGKKVPTCHRSSFDSFMDDADFEMVMENSDPVSRGVYREEAKYIEEIRKGIIEVSGKEKPYDIFICYKETDDKGERTLDSVLAQDIYDALVQKGYRVFFSRVTLEDKLGVEYEPYIFAALNSAKIMLAFGTSYEFYNAVWVKNEWSRYLKLMTKDKTKHLIPCFKGIDAYDIPKEFAKFQAQDLGKVGSTQDLLRGIQKILRNKQDDLSAFGRIPQSGIHFMGQSGGPNTSALLKRGNLALEDQEWEKAKGYFDEALNMDAENSEAYLGLVMADNGLSSIEEINKILNTEFFKKLSSDKNLEKAIRFWDDEKKERFLSLLNAAILNAEKHEIEEKEKREEQKRIEEEKRIKQAIKIVEQKRIEEEKRKEQAKKIDEENKKAEKVLESYIIKAEWFEKNIEKVRKLEIERMNLSIFRMKRKEEILEEIEVIKQSLSYCKSEFLTSAKKIVSSKYVLRMLTMQSPTLALYCILEGETFGRFPNGKPIEWIMLREESDRVLILSKYILDNNLYHDTRSNTTWSSCTIRYWLNTYFFDTAFTNAEKARILETEIKDEKIMSSNTKKGFVTKDRIFLLSTDEACELFASNGDRKGVYLNGNIGAWWLRTCGFDEKCASHIDFGGDIRTFNYVDSSNGVRPALWLSIKK